MDWRGQSRLRIQLPGRALIQSADEKGGDVYGIDCFASCLSDITDGRIRRKYRFTAAMDEEIRRSSYLFLEYNNRKSLSGCARRLQLPSRMVTRRGAAVGLARVKQPAWSAGEAAVLARWGLLTPSFSGSSRRRAFNAP